MKVVLWAFGLCILSTVSASLGLAQERCTEVYRSNPEYLYDDQFTGVIFDAKGSTKELVSNAGKTFENLHILIKTESSFGFFPKLVVSREGNHAINRLARRLFEKEGTQIVYDPKVLSDSRIAYFDHVNNIIYLSHMTARSGRLDASFFHELRHWHLFRKSKESQTYTNSEFTNARIASYPFRFRSLYEGLFNAEEGPVWNYELKLQTRHHLHQYRKGIESLAFINDYRFTVEERHNIATDSKNLIQYYKNLVETQKATIKVSKDNQMALVTLSYQFKHYRIYVPLKHYQSLKGMSKPQLETFAMNYLNRVGETVNRDIEVLDKVVEQMSRMTLSRTGKEMIEILEEIDRLLAGL